MILGDAAVKAAPMDANAALWDNIKNHQNFGVHVKKSCFELIYLKSI